MMKRIIAIVALSAIFMTIPVQAATATFSDVPSNHWATPYINKAVNEGVMAGIGGGKFDPDRPLTCAEFLTMLVRRFYEDKIVTGTGGSWYTPYMTVAAAESLLVDVEATADKSISRYDMAQVLYNVMKSQEIKFIRTTDSFQIPDWDSIPVKYQDAVSASRSQGLLAGIDKEGTFDGESAMTRAQAAVVIGKFSTALPANVPAGATKVTFTSWTPGMSHDFAEVCVGGIHINPHLGTWGSGLFDFSSKGYNTITFTVRAGSADTRIDYRTKDINASYLDPITIKEEFVVKAGESETFTFDCSGTKLIRFAANKDNPKGLVGQFAECWFTDMYLY